MRRSFKIIVITPKDFLKNEIPVLVKLFSLGLKHVHVRKPGHTKKEIAAYLTLIPTQFRQRVVLHSHYSLIKQFKLKGAHLSERSRSSERKNNYLRKEKIKVISTSFHSLRTLLKNEKKYKYVFLSPVFDSISKPGYKSKLNLEKLLPLVKKSGRQVVALGGITNKNIETIKENGFAGAAVLGYIWQARDPIANYKKIILKIE